MFPTDGEVIVNLYGLTWQNSECKPENTLHVDSFLYDDDAIDDLVEEGKMSRAYCLDCGSHKTQPLSDHVKIAFLIVQTSYHTQ